MVTALTPFAATDIVAAQALPPDVGRWICDAMAPHYDAVIAAHPAATAAIESGDPLACKRERAAVRKLRLAAETERKAIKDSSLRTGRAIDAVGKLVVDVCSEIEAALEAVERAEERRIAAERQALHDERRAALAPLMDAAAIASLDLGGMTAAAWGMILDGARAQHERAEAERQRAEAQRAADLAEEHERLRVAAIERARAEAEIAAAKAIADAEIAAARAKADAERKAADAAAEAERAAARAKADAEAAERRRQDLARQAALDAERRELDLQLQRAAAEKAAAEKAAAEKAAAEKAAARAAAAAPDAAKLDAFAAAIDGLAVPAFADAALGDRCRALLRGASAKIRATAAEMRGAPW